MTSPTDRRSLDLVHPLVLEASPKDVLFRLGFIYSKEELEELRAFVLQHTTLLLEAPELIKKIEERQESAGFKISNAPLRPDVIFMTQAELDDIIAWSSEEPVGGGAQPLLPSPAWTSTPEPTKSSRRSLRSTHREGPPRASALPSGPQPGPCLEALSARRSAELLARRSAR